MFQILITKYKITILKKNPEKFIGSRFFSPRKIQEKIPETSPYRLF